MGHFLSFAMLLFNHAESDTYPKIEYVKILENVCHTI